MLFSGASLFASTSVTENDPSTIVEGVSVITGDFCTMTEDLAIQGAEPIVLRHTYISGKGTWDFINYLVCYQKQISQYIGPE
jgi:transketolase C-terminal domain/subunit